MVAFTNNKFIGPQILGWVIIDDDRTIIIMTPSSGQHCHPQTCISWEGRMWGTGGMFDTMPDQGPPPPLLPLVKKLKKVEENCGSA